MQKLANEKRIKIKLSRYKMKQVFHHGNKKQKEKTMRKGYNFFKISAHNSQHRLFQSNMKVTNNKKSILNKKKCFRK